MKNKPYFRCYENIMLPRKGKTQAYGNITVLLYGKNQYAVKY